MLTFPPDSSFFIQLVSFFILWMGMKRLLFDPVLQVLEQREARTSGAHHAAAEMNAAAQASAADYERRLHEVRSAITAEMQSARGATQGEERQLLDQARANANTQLAQLRESLNRQAQATRAELANEARELAGRMVERVVGRPLP